jgi:hypothetical protein
MWIYPAIAWRFSMVTLVYQGVDMLISSIIITIEIVYPISMLEINIST